MLLYPASKLLLLSKKRILLSLAFLLLTSALVAQGPIAKGQAQLNAGLEAQVGCRSTFNDKIGVNLKFGGGNAFSGGKVGVSVRL
jgi:hypothetical protein